MNSEFCSRINSRQCLRPAPEDIVPRENSPEYITTSFEQ